MDLPLVRIGCFVLLSHAAGDMLQDLVWLWVGLPLVRSAPFDCFHVLQGLCHTLMLTARVLSHIAANCKGSDTLLLNGCDAITAVSSAARSVQLLLVAHHSNIKRKPPRNCASCKHPVDASVNVA